MPKKKHEKYDITKHTFNPEGKIHISMPRERVYIPQFVDNRDNMLAHHAKAGRGQSYYQHQGHRVDRNRDHMGLHFLTKTDAEWILMIDTDMEHPMDLGIRLSKWAKPIVGGLYFHRGNTHDPFVFRKGEFRYVNDLFGREKQQWVPMRDEIYDFLRTHKVPNRDGAVTIGQPGELGLIECDAVATGALLIHRSVLEHMQTPWFEYREGGNSEDLVFCDEAKYLYDIPVHCDMSTISGHYKWQPMGHTQFLQLYEARGVNLSLYTQPQMAKIVAGFLEVEPEKALQEIQESNATMVSTYWRSKKPKTAKEIRDFYEDPHTGYLYLLELIHWNVSPVFDYFKQQLLPYRNMNVVELGSGIGSMAIQMALQGCDVIAVEPNDYLRKFAVHRWEDMLKILAGRAGEIKFVSHEWKTLGTETADMIIAVDVIEHLAKEDAQEFVQEAARILKPAGKMFYHNNWGQQDLYPMHFDYSKEWPVWLAENGLVETSQLSAQKMMPESNPTSDIKEEKND